MAQKSNEINHFLNFLNRLLARKLSGQEKIAVKVAIYDIFQENYALESIYSEILEYLAREEKVKSLIPEVKDYYLKG